MKILTRGHLVDMDPMDSEANAGAELDRMFPTANGFGSTYSNLGFWNPEMMQGVLRAQMEQEQGNRQSRTAQNIANTKADSDQAQLMAQLFGQFYGTLPMQGLQMENAREIANAKQQMDMIREMHGIKSKEGIAKQQAESAMERAKIQAKATTDAAEKRAQGQSMSAREPTNDDIMVKVNEMKTAAQGKQLPSDSSLRELAREELIRGRVEGKMNLRSNPPTPKGTSETKAMSAYAPETISPDLLASDPDAAVLSMMGGMPIPQRNTARDKDAAMDERFPIPSAAELYEQMGPRESQPLPSYTPAGPMAKFASKPGGTAMTSRMYAPPDELANPGNKGQVQWPTVRNEQGQTLQAGGVQGSQVMNDPRVAAREQSMKNLMDLNFGGLPQPQSEFSKRNPEAFAELLKSQGLFVTDQDIPVGPTVRQTEQTRNEDVLRAPESYENRKLIESIIGYLPDMVKPGARIGAKTWFGDYGKDPTRGESPILEMLPYLAGAIGGAAGIGGAGRAAPNPRQLLLNRGSWTNTEPLQLPGGQAPGLPGRGPQGALPSAGNQGRITPNIWDMPPGGQQGALPPGGGPIDLQPRVPQGIPRATPMDLGNVRPMGAAPQYPVQQLPGGLTSKGAIPGDMWSMLKRLYDLRTTGVY